MKQLCLKIDVNIVIMDHGHEENHSMKGYVVKYSRPVDCSNLGCGNYARIMIDRLCLCLLVIFCYFVRNLYVCTAPVRKNGYADYREVK